MPSSACDWSSDVCSSDRSEEHTSELQSRSDLVCRLLLEKKKKNTRTEYKAHVHPSNRIHPPQTDAPSSCARLNPTHPHRVPPKTPMTTLPPALPRASHTP